MPKETIPAVTDPYRVQVGWRPDGGVQVGVALLEGRSILWQLFGDEKTLGHLGSEVEKMGQISYDGDVHRGKALLDTLDVASNGGYAGLWSDLDRRGCNDLIRVLRRARDSAFGRDE